MKSRQKMQKHSVPSFSLKRQAESRVPRPSNSTPATWHGGRQKRRFNRYIDKLDHALGNYEKVHPNWRTEAFFWIIDYALRSLQRCLESERESGITWKSPFVELQYPVEWNWKAWGKGDTVQISLISGVLTKTNTVNRKTAAKTLAEIMVKHVSILAMQDFTNHVAFEKRGTNYVPILPGGLVECLGSLKGKREKRLFLESLFKPYSMGAACIEIDENKLKPNARVPNSITHELARVTEMIDLPPLEWTGNINGHSLRISLIFQIHPLIVNVSRRRAYFPITVGLLLVPADTSNAEKLLALMGEPWAHPSNWSPEDRDSFWKQVFVGLRGVSGAITRPPSPEVDEAVVTVNAKLKISVRRGDPTAHNAIMGKMIQSFGKTGQILEMNCQIAALGGTPSVCEKQSLNDLVEHVDVADSADDKGRALEDLMSALFNSVPGFKVSQRVRTQTEEIDLTISNNSNEWWLKREAAVILVECKNWLSRCGKNEFVTFKEKMVNRKGRCSLGFLISWNGFADTVTKEMLRGSREETLVVPMDGQQVREAICAGSFLQVISAAWDAAMTI